MPILLLGGASLLHLLALLEHKMSAVLGIGFDPFTLPLLGSQCVKYHFRFGHVCDAIALEAENTVVPGCGNVEQITCLGYTTLERAHRLASLM